MVKLNDPIDETFATNRRDQEISIRTTRSNAKVARLAQLRALPQAQLNDILIDLILKSEGL